jgi:hypothetical protein
MSSMRAMHATDANSPFVRPPRSADNAVMQAMEAIMQFTLQARETAALTPACTVRVRCQAGALWITSGGGGDDVVLEAGDSTLLSSACQLYFSALGRDQPAAFELSCDGA